MRCHVTMQLAMHFRIAAYLLLKKRGAGYPAPISDILLSSTVILGQRLSESSPLHPGQSLQ